MFDVDYRMLGDHNKGNDEQFGHYRRCLWRNRVGRLAELEHKNGNTDE